MTYTLYTDNTGTGTGDFVDEFDDLEKAREEGLNLWSVDCGFTIHRSDPQGDGRDEVIVACPPTHPECDYPERPDCDAWDDLDPNEPPDLPQF